MDGSVGFVDKPIGMGPATTLLSPRRYNLGAAGGKVLELIAPPSIADKEGEAVDRLYQDAMEQCYRIRDSVSTDAGEDSTSTSIIMDVLDNDVTTVNNPTHSDKILPANSTSAAGINTGVNHPSMLEQINIDVAICKAYVTRLELQAVQHDAQLDWAQQEFRRTQEESNAMKTSIEELTNQVKELTARLESGAVSLQSIADICTFRAADFRTLLLKVQQQQRDYSTSSSTAPIDPPPAREPVSAEPAQPLAACMVGEPLPLDPGPQVPHLNVLQPSTPDRSLSRDFCNPNVQISSSPRTDPAPSSGGQGGISVSITSSRGKITTIRKSIIRQVDALKSTINDTANENTDLKKLKYLQTKTVPRLEKAIMELETTLQKFSRTCDDAELDLMTATVDEIIEGATKFVTQVTRLYNDNEGYAPGLMGQEKALMEIKPFSAGSDITVFEFIDKFNAYCSGTKKAKAYKLYHNYLSISIKPRRSPSSMTSTR